MAMAEKYQYVTDSEEDEEETVQNEEDLVENWENY